MSFGISIEITREELGITETVAAKIAPDMVARVAARGVRNRVQERFQELEDTKPNKRGWPRQHLWAQLRRSTQAPMPAGPGLFTIDINHVAAAQILWGGVIRPVNVKFLTLPATGEAYGTRAREHADLKFGFAPDPELGGAIRPALIQTEQSVVTFGRQRKDGTRKVNRGATFGGTVFFWLTRRVNQQPFPGMLPTQEQMKAAGLEPAQEYVARVTGGGV
jgi:hypothetical protein